MFRTSGIMFLATFILVSHATLNKTADRECIDSHGKKGSCVPLRECPEFDAVLSQPVIMQEQLQMLTAASRACNSDIAPATAIVCCSATSLLPKACTLPGQNDAQTEGLCVPEDDCMSWKGFSQRRFKSKKELEKYQAAQKSCRSQDGRTVCCAKERYIKAKEESPSDSSHLTEPKCLQDRLGKSNKHNGTYPSDSNFIAYVVYTIVKGNEYSTGRCGGSLITPEYVLTAAHCVQGYNQLFAYIGANHVDQFDPRDGQYYPDVEVTEVGEQIIHENYNNFTYAYDIALLRLDLSINYTNPVCIPTASQHYNAPPESIARVLYTFGWGSNIEGALTSSKQRVTLQEISFEDCLNGRPHNANDTLNKDLNICTYTVSGHNVFPGYSGSPLMYRQKEVWFMVGLISYRFDVNNKLSNLYVSVATSIGKQNEDWIVENILSRS